MMKKNHTVARQSWLGPPCRANAKHWRSDVVLRLFGRKETDIRLPLFTVLDIPARYSRVLRRADSLAGLRTSRSTARSLGSETGDDPREKRNESAGPTRPAEITPGGFPEP